MFRTLNERLATALLCFVSMALPAASEPTAVKVLFETRQLDQVAKGSEVTYRFERKVSDERLLGPNFADNIKLGVTKIGGNGEREVVFKVFTGENARDASSWPDLTINPLFIWYLDRAVGTFNTLAGGNQLYLKSKFREALRDKARIESIKFTLNGKEIDAYRVTVRPYADDLNTQQMEGFEVSKFTIVVSDDAPGYFVDLVSTFESKVAAAPKLEEHISLVGIGETK